MALDTLPFGYGTAIATYISYFILLVIGHCRDQFGKIFTPYKFRFFLYDRKLPPLITLFDSFYIRRLYYRIRDCWNRPICGVAGRKIEILERISHDNNTTMEFTGEKLKVLNIGSYNYLGFAQNEGDVHDKVMESVDTLNTNYSYPTVDYKQNHVCRLLEKELADFLHKDDCIVFSMGYGTNTSTISALMKDSLIFSDEYNHTSLIKGMKLSGSKVVVFKHNSMTDLEQKLIYHISHGNPETKRSWDKIFVIVEGLYSMEGTVVKLRELVDLKAKYKFYIFMDEAHSIGAMGNTGRGICEYLGVDFSDVDLLMGTFSKSFGGFGGYIAANQDVIDFLVSNNENCLYGEQMSPIVAQQILQSLKTIRRDPTRLKKLHSNTVLIRSMLKKLKFYMLGDANSPVVPLLIPTPGKIAEVSRLCLERGVAVVVVGYPATPILLNRVRLCMSSSHTEDDIKKVVRVIDQIGSMIGMKR